MLPLEKVEQRFEEFGMGKKKFKQGLILKGIER